jgi:hypothetical protein
MRPQLLCPGRVFVGSDSAGMGHAFTRRGVRLCVSGEDVTVGERLAAASGSAHHDDRARATAVGRLNRPNVLVKIPATREGLPATGQAVSEGINADPAADWRIRPSVAHAAPCSARTTPAVHGGAPSARAASRAVGMAGASCRRNGRQRAWPMRRAQMADRWIVPERRLVEVASAAGQRGPKTLHFNQGQRNETSGKMVDAGRRQPASRGGSV